jgi:hypothetical protein
MRITEGAKVVSLAEVKRQVKRKQIIAQYVKFYGNVNDNRRKATN